MVAAPLMGAINKTDTQNLKEMLKALGPLVPLFTLPLFIIEKLIRINFETWDQHKSKRTILTEEGTKLTKELWSVIPDPYKELAIKVKERIHLLTPERVRHLVHTEYPEYKDSYMENGIE